MNYRNAIEEQIKVLEELQSHTHTVNEKIKIAEMISQLSVSADILKA